MDSLLRWTLAGDSSSTLTSEILRRYAGTIQLKDGERGRLDHSRRRPADELVAFALGTNRRIEPAAPTVRRDAEQSDRDDRAPLFRVHRSGFGASEISRLEVVSPGAD